MQITLLQADMLHVFPRIENMSNEHNGPIKLPTVVRMVRCVK